ncbi:MAG: ATP-dependent DNA helicase [Myxococcota bacterium]|nr:ATP-dependent DNA helicase [Myxococcota bacterium]
MTAASDVLGEGGLLARSIPGYEHRPSQVRMAELVERALGHDGVALIEAGTGTGKTLAYLVPAALSHRRIVISTGTRTLQDQLVEHDVPRLERALGMQLPITVLKGLPNYLCLRRYEELSRAAESEARPELSRMLPMIREWRERTETGDRAELVDLPEEAPIWAAVQSGSDTRVGPRCKHYEDCFVTSARRRAEDARIVVVNHHLFFADLALRAHGGGVIPNYDAVIFDEAHQIEDVATAFFGVQISTQRIDAMLRDAERAMRAAGALEAEGERLLRTIALKASDLFAALPRSATPEGGRSKIPEPLLQAGVRDSLFALDVALEALAEHARLRVSLGDGIAQTVRRAEQVRLSIGTIAEPGASNVAWTQQRGRLVSIGASPVDVSTLFRDEVLHRVRSIVFTSATLATGRRSTTAAEGEPVSSPFAFTKQRLGIDFEVDEEVLPSPFDYSQQAALYLPTLPVPRDPDFLPIAAAEIDALISLSGGGAFVLCTSFRVMNELARRLRPSLLDRGLPMMVQGEQPKNVQLDRFRAAGNAVLFATQSFWEGVDVPGSALRLVVIDKLPFEVPSDPLVEARCTRIEAGEGSAFMDYLVPSAALALKQGFGRLVRTARDRGIVALLDSRVRTKGYGKVLLRSLPDARRCTTMGEVEEFWRGNVDLRDVLGR